MSERTRTVMAWVIWLLAALFYFYEFLIRVSPSVMIADLMTSFRVDAAALGALSAFYLYVYAPMQIPVGLLIDRFGARRLLTIATLTCGIGGIVFGVAPALWFADGGRILMGFGSAFAYVGMIYVSARWFPAEKLPFLIGLGTSFGMLGAIAGEVPVSYFVSVVGWRTTAIGFGIVGLFLAAIVYLAIRNTPVFGATGKTREETAKGVWHNLRSVCSNYQTWIDCIVSSGMYTTTAVFAGLWGPSFFEYVYHMNRELAATVTSTFYLGWLIGSPIISYFAMSTHRRRPYLKGGTLAGMILMAALIWIPHLPIWLIITLLILCGLASSTQVLTFTIAVEVNKPAARATAAAFINFMVMLVASILQPVVGSILDITGLFQIAMIVFPASFAVAFLASLLLKPHKKPL